MSEQSKDDLSRFFRKASQKPDITFNEQDWTKMEAMLDKASVRAASSGRMRRKVAVIGTASLALLFIATYFVATKTDLFTSGRNVSADTANQLKTFESANTLASPKIKTLTDIEDERTASVQSAQKEHTVVEHLQNEEALATDDTKHVAIHKKDNSVAASNRQMNTSDNRLTDHSRKNESPSQDFVAKPQLLTDHVTDKSTVINNNRDADDALKIMALDEAPTEQENAINKHTLSLAHSVITEKPTNDLKNNIENAGRSIEKNVGSVVVVEKQEQQVVTNDLPPALETSIDKSRDNQVRNEAPHVSSTIDAATDSAIKKGSSPVTQKETPEEIDSVAHQDESAMSSRLSFLFSFSPDFSSYGMKRLTTPGEAVGLMGYYAVSKRFSVFTGVIGSNKKYLSYGKEYKPNEDHYWAKHTNGMLPSEIQGSCSMLEIPVGIQYTVLNAKRSHLRVSGMLSSYIMFNESYHYTFTTENPGAAQGWKTKKTSDYLFSIAGASLSYEYDVSNHLAFGFSPYIKVPLREIGSWTDMKLYTVGAAITVRYTLQKKKLPDRPSLQRPSD